MKDCSIYVVNLDRSPERLLEIPLQLEKFGLSFERVQAVDGKHVSEGQKALLDEKGWNYGIKVRSIHPFLGRHNKGIATTLLPTGGSKLKLVGIKRWPASQHRINTEFERFGYAIRHYLKEQQQ